MGDLGMSEETGAEDSPFTSLAGALAISEHRFLRIYLYDGPIIFNSTELLSETY